MKLNLVIASAVTAIFFVGCSGGSPNTQSITPLPAPASIVSTQPGNYAINIFAKITGSLVPDDMVQLGSSVYVIAQDKRINPDGTIPAGVTGAQSVLLQYDLNGNLQNTYDLPGHPDGLTVYDSATLWISSNEDANPLIIVFKTASGTATTYASDVASLPHGGGLDDMKVINGVVYATASNPSTTMNPTPNLAPYTTDASGATGLYGVNMGPGVYAVSLNSDGATFHSTPVLMSNTTVNSLPSNTPITLNMTDSDSSAIDPNGNLVVTSQQDSELVTISQIGTPSQSVSVVNMTLYTNPWPLDDTRWSPASGGSFMLVSDAPAQTIYRVTSAPGFAPNVAYSAGVGTILQSNTTTGVMTPIFTGLNNPHGLIFVQPG